MICYATIENKIKLFTWRPQLREEKFFLSDMSKEHFPSQSAISFYIVFLINIIFILKNRYISFTSFFVNFGNIYY